MTTRYRHHGWKAAGAPLLTLAITTYAASAGQKDWSEGPASWQEDLTPISPAEWSYGHAEQLLARASFGGTPEEIGKLAAMTPEHAVRYLVSYDAIPNDHVQPFVHSGFWDETLSDFPPSRPAATDLALEQGESMGIRVKPDHVNRHMQPVSDRFFYWLRATNLETRRVGYWWAERMLDIATAENKLHRAGCSRSRPYFLHHRELIGELARLAYDTVREMMSVAVDEPTARPGMVAVIQTFASSLKWNPHIHSITSRGVWTPDGEWIPVAYVDEHRAELLFRHKLLTLLRDRGLISQERIDLLHSWRYSGFSVHNRTTVYPADTEGLHELACYLMRAPVNLSRLRFDPTRALTDSRPATAIDTTRLARRQSNTLEHDRLPPRSIRAQTHGRTYSPTSPRSATSRRRASVFR